MTLEFKDCYVFTLILFIVGCENQKLPVYNTAIICSGLMELVGRMVAHSIVQVNAGIPFLAPAIYKYISSNGDINQVMESLTMDQLAHGYAKEICEKVTCDEMNFKTIMNSHPFVQYMISRQCFRNIHITNFQE